MATGLFRLLIVDDHEPFRRFIRSTLQNRPELNIIGEVSDGLAALQKTIELNPDLILLDIGLPKLNGLEAARLIRRLSPQSKIIFVSQESSADVVQQVLSLGARGYVAKMDAARELLPAVDAVLEGKRFVSASLATHNLMTSTGASETGDRVEDNPYLRLAGNALIFEFLTSVIDATAADFGTVQLFDSANSVLRIVAQHGFESEFLNYFDTVSDGKECVCGAAMKGRSRTVVTDVATDPLFSDESRGVLLRANVRSVQSTPLIDPLGKLVGMVSTHSSHPGSPMPDALGLVDNLSASFLAKIEA